MADTTEHDTAAEEAQETAVRTTHHDFEKGSRHPDVRHEGDAPDGVRAILDAAAAGSLAPEQSDEQQDALEWLLQSFDSPDDEKVTLHTMSLNVGGIGPNEKRIKWTVRNVDGALLRKLRESAMGGSRRAGTPDLTAVYDSNVQVILEGTVYPDLRSTARQRGLADPAALVEEAFKTKPGLVEAIAGTIMDISGYDPDAARDEREVAVTGNS